jgi:serine/threonine protein kinase
MWDIASGLLAMHANRFAHRDLKPENILGKTVELNGKSILVFKISDFGTAKTVNRIVSSGRDTMCYNTDMIGFGTLFYKSPEFILLDLGGSASE